MSKFKQKLLLLLALPMLLLGGMTGVAAADCANPATTKEQIQCGVDKAGGNSANPDSGSKLTTTVKTIINVLSIFAGAIAVIMIIYAGIRYVTSAGNDSAVTSAKNTILYAVIGLVVVAVAQVIVRFVLNVV